MNPNAMHQNDSEPDLDRVLEQELAAALAAEATGDAEGLSPSEAAAKEALFRQTSRVVRGRRGRRRSVLAVAGVLLFATGFGLAELIAASQRPFIHIEVRDAAGRTTVARGVPKTARETALDRATRGDAEIAANETNDDDPARLEREAAVASEADRAALWRRAGDLWFEKRGDVQGALRCYRRYLDEAESTATDVAAGSSDNWLLRDLLNGRRRGENVRPPAASNETPNPERGEER